LSASSYYGHGKLLITGEYLVLRGAEALAVPLRLGQHFTMKKARGADLHWKALRPDGQEWFKGVFSLFDFSAQDTSDPEFAAGITRVLNAIARQNPDFLADWKGQSVESRLEFQPEWGLGTSSTLIYAMAEWGEAEPFTLLEHTFGGSGYDLACASAEGPVLYQSTDEEIRITPCSLEWDFRDRILLVWSGRKENSRQSVAQYQEALQALGPEDIKAVSDLAEQVTEARDLDTFRQLMEEHNRRIGAFLGQDPNPWAPGYPGLIKPLGAWGGDFFLAASPEDPAEMRRWFSQRGFDTLFSWSELVLED
jgi:mevalonate kinase